MRSTAVAPRLTLVKPSGSPAQFSLARDAGPCQPDNYILDKQAARARDEWRKSLRGACYGLLVVISAIAIAASVWQLGSWALHALRMRP